VLPYPVVRAVAKWMINRLLTFLRPSAIWSASGGRADGPDA
jgi:hypothetical protein